jgi:hypothetical protein
MASIAETVERFNRISKIRLTELVDKAAHDEVIRFAKKQFVSQGGYGGKPWAYYGGEPKYRAYKEAMGASPLPLRWTSTMQRVYPALTDPNHPDHQWQSQGNNVSLQIGVPYFARLQEGGVNQFGENFPARVVYTNSNGRLGKDVADKIKREFYDLVRKT